MNVTSCACWIAFSEETPIHVIQGTKDSQKNLTNPKTGRWANECIGLTCWTMCKWWLTGTWLTQLLHWKVCPTWLITYGSCVIGVPWVTLRECQQKASYPPKIVSYLCNLSKKFHEVPKCCEPSHFLPGGVFQSMLNVIHP